MTDRQFCKEVRTLKFRKEEYEFVCSFFIDKNGEEWTTTNLDEANINQVYNQYRVRHGIPFPAEIAHLRDYYEVSASMMSEILGFGTNQWRLYEDGMMPSESNARAIIAVRSKSIFLEYLEAAKDEIGERLYSRIKERVEKLPDYIRPSKPSETSGYVSYNSKKIAEAMKFFTKTLNGVFTTKMNKLLFYTDFLKYKHDGFGMTGLEYRAITYGPVPNGYGEVYTRAKGIEMEDYIYPNGTSGQLLTSLEAPDMSVFSDAEKDILSAVCRRFKDANAGEISEQSHQEKGWIECVENKKLIPYRYAFDISE